jgi:tyrosyl-tRNA synthetase
MASSSPSLHDELRWRGLLHQETEGCEAHLAKGPATGYCGFDPTAESLHVGNLVSLMGLVRLARAGHRAVALVGGGTAVIGDPSGKSEERPMRTVEEIEANAALIWTQIQRVASNALGAEAAARFTVRNNAEWLGPQGLIEFLRDTGKHFTVNWMMQKDSVKTRMETGISFTEFSYMLLQAYDFQRMHVKDGVTLQIGGSDQWGNITAGTELIRRTVRGEAHGLTFPLLTDASGKKFGKTEAGAVYLDAGLTSVYKFYQFWINAEDRDASRFLRFFTLMSRDDVEALDRAIAERPEGREAQAALAMDVTTRVHGEESARTARDASRILFDRKADPRTLSPAALQMLRDEIPFRRLTAVRDVTIGHGDPVQASVVDMLVETGLVKSKGDAKRQLQQGAVSVNGRRLGAEDLSISAAEAIAGVYFLIRKGAREMALVELA